MSDIPKYLLTGIRNATRAFEQDNPAALATISEHLQPLVDAAMRYANRKAEQEAADLRAQLQAAREDHAADLRKAADEFAACIAEERKVIDGLESRLAATWPKGDE